MSSRIVLRTCVLASLLLAAACAPNAAWRKLDVAQCGGEETACRDTTASTEDYASYSVSYVEFSERGNLFDRRIYEDVLQRVRRQAADTGVLVVVFVHGWKHNASPSDANVIDFRKALGLLAASKLPSKRRVHGVYVGWRGKSLYGLGSENLTYWDRKAAAEEIGNGGVTELLLGLEAATGKLEALDNKNLLLVVGHSFGGAVTLSALNDVLLERMNTYLGDVKGPYPAFGSGVILLNPAIEANSAFQLKELSQRIGRVGLPKAKVLHVVSSEADTATQTPFWLGQLLGVGLTWNHETIDRHFGKQELHFSELDLDTITIGNYKRFHTARLERDRVPGRWAVSSRCEDAKAELDADSAPIPCTSRDPVAFVYTSPDFIQSHNDVFNLDVLAYLAAAVSDALKDTRITDGQPGRFRQRPSFPECLDAAGAFSFDLCFAHNRRMLEGDKAKQDRKAVSAR